MVYMAIFDGDIILFVDSFAILLVSPCFVMPFEEHPAIDTLHVQRRQRLTLQDFKEGSDVWDILKPRMCVGGPARVTLW